MAFLGLEEHQKGVQHAYPLGTFSQPVLTFSDATPPDLTSGVYGTRTPMDAAATGTAIGIALAGARAFEVSDVGATIVGAGLSVGGVAYTWPSAGPSAAAFLASDADEVLSWSLAPTTEDWDGRTLQYFTDPQVRRLLEEILLTLRAEGGT